ncbi:uncharacterized protein LOC131941642 [Physella acuta]|uniref:uncharacterized protein LOC131941642 n=1 Tax=Physella acuta TaxID=109671 RepID=UPI0027DCDC78|nr:uncharacterized protein LOC131941642 [Physella acuta]
MENSTLRDLSNSSMFLTFEQYLVMMFSCCILYVLVSTFGILTNIINIRTFILMGLKDAMTVSFLLLSISDLSLSVVSLVTGFGGVLYVSEFIFDDWFPVDPYIAGLFSTNLFIPLSAVVALNTSFISVARCMCVSLPFYFRNIFQRKTATTTMIVSILFCVLVYSPVFTYMGVVEKFDPVHNRSRPSAWISPDRRYLKDIVWDILNMAIPISTFAVIIVSTIIMARALTKSQKFRSANAQRNLPSGTNAAEKSRIKDNFSKKKVAGLTGKDRQVVLQVVVISLAHILCHTPTIVFILAGVIVPELTLGGRLSYLYVTVGNVCMILENINSCISLAIYYTYNSKFRQIC